MRSRAAHSLRSIENHPSIQAFVGRGRGPNRRPPPSPPFAPRGGTRGPPRVVTLTTKSSARGYQGPPASRNPNPNPNPRGYQGPPPRVVTLTTKSSARGYQGRRDRKAHGIFFFFSPSSREYQGRGAPSGWGLGPLGRVLKSGSAGSSGERGVEEAEVPPEVAGRRCGWKGGRERGGWRWLGLGLGVRVRVRGRERGGWLNGWLAAGWKLQER